MTRFGFFCCVLTLSTTAGWAQLAPSAGQNYVVEQTPRTPQTAISLTTPYTDVPAAISYFDGLGRPLQTIAARAGGDAAATDLVTNHTTYDAYGRPQRTYLPLPGSNTNGSLHTTPQTNGQAFYGDTYPYAEAVYEASPLNRPNKQWGAGNAWRTADRPQQISYGVPAANTVRRFNIDETTNAIYAYQTGNPNALDYYGPHDISSRTLTDEQNNTVTEYTDLQGRLLRRDVTLTTSQTLTTAYVYDSYERLGAVLPPKLYDWFVAGGASRTLPFYLNNNPATPNPDFRESAYAYRYDARGRLTNQHTPGAGWREQVYDQQDRLVMQQDEQERTDGQWQYTQYDGLSRVVRTGRMALSRPAADLRTDFAGVTNETYPNTVSTPESSYFVENQYDTYTGALAYQPANTFTPPYSDGSGYNATGLLTRRRTRNLKTSVWYEMAQWYDDKGRPVQQQQETVRGTTDQLDFQYRFNGELVQQRTQRNNLIELTQYQYDAVGRITAIDHQFGGGAARRLVTYQYDGIGRLLRKQLGGSGAFAPLVSSQQAGAWNAASTWQGGNVPSQPTIAAIGHLVTLPTSLQQQAAQLRFGAGQVRVPQGGQVQRQQPGGGLQLPHPGWLAGHQPRRER
jgi:YD repeat-containing protein